MVDVGAGAAVFSEGWIAVHGPPEEVALLDPIAGMLARGQAALDGLGVEARP